MLHKMKLRIEPFEKIKNGSKTIELCLNDEKRQLVQVGDVIEFSMLENLKETITVRVTALHRFDSFNELYALCLKRNLDIEQMKFPNRTIWMPIIPERNRLSMVSLELR